MGTADVVVIGVLLLILLACVLVDLWVRRHE